MFGFLCVSVNHRTHRMPERRVYMQLPREGHVMDEQIIRDELRGTIEGGIVLSRWDDEQIVFAAKITDLVLASPVIRRIQAEAWEEGERSGYENVARHMWDDGETLTNPYREKDT